jgi:hypothetical protein
MQTLLLFYYYFVNILGRFQNRNLPGMNNFRQHGVEDELELLLLTAGLF